jgi:hypothetical protein
VGEDPHEVEEKSMLRKLMIGAVVSAAALACSTIAFAQKGQSGSLAEAKALSKLHVAEQGYRKGLDLSSNLAKKREDLRGSAPAREHLKKRECIQC